MIDLKEIMTPVDRTLDEMDSIRSAVELMKQKKWDIIPVTNSEGKLQGVFTRSRLLTLVLENNPLSDPVIHYIKRETVAASLNTSYEEVKDMVKESNVGTGVVLDEERRVIGLLTKTDMVMALLRSTNSLKQQLETILEHSHLGIVMTNGEKEIIYVNDHFSHMQKKAKAAVVGKDFHTFFPTIDLSMTDSVFIPKVKVGQDQTMLRLSFYQTETGARGIIALFHDITELEQMTKELQTVKNLKQTLDTAIENAYDGILMIDENKRISMVSPPLLELFNLEKSSVLRKRIDAVLPQLTLCSVFNTGEMELSDFLEVNGIKYIVNKIPIKQDGQIIGAIGKVMHRQLNQVSELYKKLEGTEKKAEFYRKQLRQTETARFTWEQIISEDLYMEKLKKSAKKAAKGRSTILIRGESGTGKELFAHALHGSSIRKDGKFVSINCAAVPEHLLESEFFGYEDGAFTGARHKGKIGKFDLANGGTLFLDEIGDMSLALQAKLLRVLQEKEFYRVGGTARIQVDVRIIAATNRSLETMVDEGSFREDLYYRLNVISFTIPPLRERRQDIPLLIHVFMKQFNRILESSITGIDEDALSLMVNYDWPGNVRELKNVMERAMTFAEYGKIVVDDLPEFLIEQNTTSLETPGMNMAESAECSAIQKALHTAGGNKTKAAQLLGISRSGLYEKLKKYEV